MSVKSASFVFKLRQLLLSFFSFCCASLSVFFLKKNTEKLKPTEIAGGHPRTFGVTLKHLFLWPTLVTDIMFKTCKFKAKFAPGT